MLPAFGSSVLNRLIASAVAASRNMSRTDVLQLSGLLAGDLKESRNDNPTRDLQMAADRIRPQTFWSAQSTAFAFSLASEQGEGGTKDGAVDAEAQQNPDNARPVHAGRLGRNVHGSAAVRRRCGLVWIGKTDAGHVSD